MNRIKTVSLLCMLVYSICALSGYNLYAAEEPRTAKILEITGTVNVKYLGERTWLPAKVGMVLNEGDFVKTSADSICILNVDGTGETATIDVSPNSQLLLSELKKDVDAGTQKTLLDLGLGEIMIRVKKLHTTESSFEVKTPTAVCGVRGTEFAVKVEAME